MYEFADGPTYRVWLHDKDLGPNSAVSVSIIDPPDAFNGDLHVQFDGLPKWMQGRLAVLFMLEAKPPTPSIHRVGRRISQEIFWVYSNDPDKEVL